MDNSWSPFAEILILLTTAMVMGTIAERLRQSAIVGYLLAGTIVGPHVFKLVQNAQSVNTAAELGAAVLLFAIGLEFSYGKMKRMGGVIVASGVLQIVITTLCAVALLWGFSDSPTRSLVLGIMLAMSSTASVVRILNDTVSLETPFGRNAMGILLLQDVAILPLTLVVTALAQGTSGSQLLRSSVVTLLFMIVLLVGFYVAFNLIAPRLLNLRQWSTNREFPIMLAAVVAVGSAYAAHLAGISTAIGAFIAGLMLAGSPFAVQIRADVAPLKTVLVTIFFSSIGMLADPHWVVHHWQMVVAATACVVLLKSSVVWGILRLMGMPIGIAFATGLCIANVGEFSFVLAKLAVPGILNDQDLNLVVSVTVISLILAPYLVKAAPALAGQLEKRWFRGTGQPAAFASETRVAEERNRILLIGFGPAGQRVAEGLMEQYASQIHVVELNPRSAATAQRYGLASLIGNACQNEVLEQAGIHLAQIVVVTIPDPDTAQQVINLCRSLNPDVRLLVRARYHAYRWELQMAGADIVVDEEDQVGQRLAHIAHQTLAGEEVEV